MVVENGMKLLGKVTHMSHIYALTLPYLVHASAHTFYIYFCSCVLQILYSFTTLYHLTSVVPYTTEVSYLQYLILSLTDCT